MNRWLINGKRDGSVNKKKLMAAGWMDDNLED